MWWEKDKFHFVTLNALAHPLKMHFASFLVLIAILAVALSYSRNELVLQEDLEWVVKTNPKVTSKGELPVSLDYRQQGLLTMDLNQHIPVYCGSCK